MPVVLFSNYIAEDQTISWCCAKEHLLGRMLLSEGLRRLYSIETDLDDIDVMLGLYADGKPYLKEYPGIYFNITHCSGLAACVFDSCPAGIDAELPVYFAEVLINRSLSENEKIILAEHSGSAALRNEWFYRFWTLKEAYVKRSGTGVDTDLTAFSFSFSDAGIICSDPDVYCHQIVLPSGHILSVVLSRPSEEISYVNIADI